MYIIYVKNYKTKTTILGLLAILWISILFLSNFILNNSLIFNVTINNYLSFSYPWAFEVDNIYINEQFIESTIATNSTFKTLTKQNFSSYKTLKGNLSFSYPSIFTLHEEDFAGSEILYHIDFKNKYSSTHGFVQVWNLTFPLKEFLEKSKDTSLQKFSSFSSKEIFINDTPGYLWDYVIETQQGKHFKGMEVFFEKKDKMYRISYFVPENEWNKEQSDIFWHMVSSFKTY